MRRVQPDGDVLRWRVSTDERELLLSLLRQLDEALDGPLDDDVVSRLFPAVVDGDPEADADLRPLLAGDLLLGRHEAVAELVELLEGATPRRRDLLEVELRDGQPWLVLRVLNDVRLAIGARVGFEVVEARPDDLDAGTQAALAMLDLLAWFQESILEHVDV